MRPDDDPLSPDEQQALEAARDAVAQFEHAARVSREVFTMYEAALRSVHTLMRQEVLQREFFAAGWAAHANEVGAAVDLDDPAVDEWLDGYLKQRGVPR